MSTRSRRPATAAGLLALLLAIAPLLMLTAPRQGEAVRSRRTVEERITIIRLDGRSPGRDGSSSVGESGAHQRP